MKDRNTYHLRDGLVNKKYSGGEGSCFAIPHSNLEIQGSPEPTQLKVLEEPGYRQPFAHRPIDSGSSAMPAK